MKIAFLIVDYTLSRGGERATALVAGTMARQHQVSILSLYQSQPGPFFDFASLNVHVLSKDRPHGRGFLHFLKKKQREYRAVKEYLSENPVDVVIGVGSYPSILLGFIRPRNARFLAYAWEHSNYGALSGGWQILRNLAYPRLNGIICLTETDASDYRNRYSSVHIIPNMVAMPVKDLSGTRAQNILSIGAFEPEKGFDLLLAAFQLVLQRNQHWQLILIGSGSQERQLKEQAIRAGIQDHVTFKKPVRTIEQEYAAAGIYALPSRREGFGMVLLEAMAAGVPCVSFNCPTGPGALITHGKNGILVPAEHIAGLADALLMLMDDGEKRKAIAQQAQIFVQEFYPEHIIKLWDKLLKKQGDDNT